MSKATAIVFPAEREVRLETYDVEPMRPGEIRVRTEYSGVSQGTELWALTGRRPELAFPTVPGYQTVGIVEEVGADVSGFQAGQRVIFSASRVPESYARTWMGAHVSIANVPANLAVVVPDGVDPIAAAVSALPAVSLRGIDMIPVKEGDLVVVTGQGLIGQGSAQLARHRGATVVTADVNPTRLRLSKESGAHTAVNIREQNLLEVVRSIKPTGADAVIETTGRSDQFAPCIDMIRTLGHLLLQGWYPEPITFDFHKTHGKRPTIAITCGFGNDNTAEVLRLMGNGGLNFRPLVTHAVPVTEAPSLYARMLENDPEILGVVYDWSGVE